MQVDNGVWSKSPSVKPQTAPNSSCQLYPYPPEQLLRDLLSSLQQQDADPVVLVDEYDTPLLKLLGRDPAEVEPFFELFREFYRLFKQCESDLHKVLITGITRRAYGEMFSALNNLRDYTRGSRNHSMEVQGSNPLPNQRRHCSAN